MKKKNWYRSLSLADDKYIDEAHPDHVIKPQRNKVLISLAAACACIALIVCNLWLFIPFRTSPSDVSQYADSEYYTLIQNLNVLTFEKPKYKNNAEKLWAGLVNIISWGMKDATNAPSSSVAPNGTDGGSSGNYKEITDNQVEGIIEADRIKRSDTHIYYLDGTTLRIYAIDKENTQEVGSYSLFDGDSMYISNLNQWEFYLSSDCKTVTAVTQYHTKTGKNFDRYVELISLDVSDPVNIVKKENFRITGNYMSSRTVNGSVLLLTEFVINNKELDFGDASTFIPRINEDGTFYSISTEGIVSPSHLSNARYTVVTKLEESTLGLKGTAAYLSYSENVYVSENHVFLTQAFTDEKENKDGTVTKESMTEISCLTYGGDSFENKGSITVRGTVKDQWSMDEYEGVLRIFTTTNETVTRKWTEGLDNVYVNTTAQSNASLYCVDLCTFEIIASVIDFAPPNESVRSVRFDKETAYVCTSVQLSDPVFFFDLSDLNHITYKDTGTIEGFSTSLINLGNGYLLGIGRGGRWSTFKVEVYEETASGIRSVDSYEIENAEYSTEYKSYYVDRTNQLIGIGVTDLRYHPDRSKYILLHFDGYGLAELLAVPLKGAPENMRGVYIDGYMYMFGREDFRVEKIFG